MRHRGLFSLAIAFSSLLVFSRPLVADVRLPAVFTDNAVLQRDIPVPVWGWADQGEQVTVKIGDQSKTATPDAKTGQVDRQTRSPAQSAVPIRSPSPARTRSR